MMRATCCAVGFLLLLASPSLAQNTCNLALTQWQVRQNVTGQLVEAATNADGSYNATSVAAGTIPQLSLARVTLAPCGVRVMHIHQNVDELLYVVSSGPAGVSVSTAFANGAICEQSVLTTGQAYMYPRNLIHSARNLDCKTPAVVLGFFTAFNSATVNAAIGALNMPGGPFLAYADPKNVDSLKAAAAPSTLAFDAKCLATCKLPATGGQQPVNPSGSPYP